MSEVLTATVVTPEGNEVELEVVYTGDDSLVFYLNGDEMFSADWSSNLMKLFIRALQLWFNWDALK